MKLRSSDITARCPAQRPRGRVGATARKGCPGETAEADHEARSRCGEHRYRPSQSAVRLVAVVAILMRSTAHSNRTAECLWHHPGHQARSAQRMRNGRRVATQHKTTVPQRAATGDVLYKTLAPTFAVLLFATVILSSPPVLLPGLRGPPEHRPSLHRRLGDEPATHSIPSSHPIVWSSIDTVCLGSGASTASSATAGHFSFSSSCRSGSQGTCLLDLEIVC